MSRCLSSLSSGSGASSTNNGGGGSGGLGFGGAGQGGAGFIGDPTTCEEAANSKTYIGCDFWPTVTPNNVWSIFDYAVVVANTGDNVVDVSVERGGQVVATAQIAPDSLLPNFAPSDFNKSGAVIP